MSGEPTGSDRPQDGPGYPSPSIATSASVATATPVETGTAIRFRRPRRAGKHSGWQQLAGALALAAVAGGGVAGYAAAGGQALSGSAARLTARLPTALRPASTTRGPRLDRTQLLPEPSFVEDFRRPPSFYDPVLAPEGRWKTSYAFGPQDPRSAQAWRARAHFSNREEQFYGDPLRGTSPFVWAPGRLDIVASRSQGNPALHGQPYLSGLMTTERSFDQAYGYFEIRCTMPTGQGLWPAFWLLPRPEILPDPMMRQLPDEVDVFENIGRTDEIWASLHANVDGRRDGTRKSDSEPVHVDTLDRMHDYGVLVTPSKIAWYIDGAEVRHVANVSFHRPAYLLVNLAVGGKWPGPADASTPIPARMEIAWIRAWKLRNARTGTSAQGAGLALR